jgi:plastocyanin
VRKRLALIVSVGMLLVVMAAPPVSSAVVIKGVACSSCQPFPYKWKPRITTVATGTRVTWKSVVGFHNVTSMGSNWSKKTTISAGQTTSFTFNASGTYRFRCTFHSTVSNGKCSGMCGKVVVG